MGAINIELPGVLITQQPLLLCYSEVNKVGKQEESGGPGEKRSAAGIYCCRAKPNNHLRGPLSDAADWAFNLCVSCAGMMAVAACSQETTRNCSFFVPSSNSSTRHKHLTRNHQTTSFATPSIQLILDHVHHYSLPVHKAVLYAEQMTNRGINKQIKLFSKAFGKPFGNGSWLDWTFANHSSSLPIISILVIQLLGKMREWIFFQNCFNLT